MKYSSLFLQSFKNVILLPSKLGMFFRWPFDLLALMYLGLLRIEGALSNLPFLPDLFLSLESENKIPLEFEICVAPTCNGFLRKGPFTRWFWWVVSLKETACDSLNGGRVWMSVVSPFTMGSSFLPGALTVFAVVAATWNCRPRPTALDWITTPVDVGPSKAKSSSIVAPSSDSDLFL